jgi:cystathionine beta-synthase
VEGIGEDFVPKTFNSQLVDDWVRISDAESFKMARELSRCEGILAGGSSGTNVAAALRYARRLTANDLVVTIVCDTGRNYLSKFYDDAWLAENQLLWEEQPRQTVGDLVRMRSPRPLQTINPDATVDAAITLMQSADISQLPVLQDGKPVGSIQEVTLTRLLHDNRDPSTLKVGEIMARPLPALDLGVQLDEAYRLLLAGNPGVLATASGQVVGIITRIDLVDYWRALRRPAKS